MPPRGQRVRDRVDVLELDATIEDIVRRHVDHGPGPAHVEAARGACAHLGRSQAAQREGRFEGRVDLHRAARGAGSLGGAMRSGVRAHVEVSSSSRHGLLLFLCSLERALRCALRCASNRPPAIPGGLKFWHSNALLLSPSPFLAGFLGAQALSYAAAMLYFLWAGRRPGRERGTLEMGVFFLVLLAGSVVDIVLSFGAAMPGIALGALDSALHLAAAVTLVAGVRAPAADRPAPPLRVYAQR
mgnify:CR=1 FL=1